MFRWKKNNNQPEGSARRRKGGGTAGGSRGVRSPAALERSPPGFVALARVGELVDAQNEHGDVGRIIWGGYCILLLFV